MPYMVMVCCPNTNKAISTGVVADIPAFSQLEPHELRCPECAEVHTWSITDAWLRDHAYALGQLELPAQDAHPQP